MASLISITAPSIPLLLRRRCAPTLAFPALLPAPPRPAVISRLFPAPHVPDFETSEVVSRVEGFLYSVADAAESAKDSGDWLAGITGSLETVLKVLKDGLSTLHVPYPYGFAIILLTVFVKAATFPLTRKQVESALSMRSLQPQVKAIQKRYAGDQERIQLETARLYKLAGVNPLAGCLPTLITIPIWIGLYRALSNVANEGLLSEGFFWIPSLAGPTTIAARQSGSGISWLFPFVDGHPPLGWPDTLAYLVLPLLLVISQYTSAQLMQPPQADDPSQKNAQLITKFLPLMIGYFALSVPSGLSLYWLTNNVLSSAQQIWLQKLGGAKNPVQEYIDKTNRDESLSIGKNIPETLNTFDDARKTKVKQSQGENGSSNRLAPGERFKQIKEQEERRRKEREENKGAQEAASEYQMTNEQNNKAKLNENEVEELKNDLMELELPIANNSGFKNHGLNGLVNSRDENDTTLHGVSQEVPTKNEAE